MASPDDPQQIPSDPLLNDPGPQGGTKRERYNTQFLVNNFAAEQRRTRLIVVGVAVAVLFAGGMGMLFTKSAEHPKPAAADKAAPAASEAGKPVDAGKPASGAKPVEAAKPAEVPKAAPVAPKK